MFSSSLSYHISQSNYWTYITYTHTTPGNLRLLFHSPLKNFENNFLNNTPFISTFNELASLSLAFTVGWFIAALSQEFFSFFILASLHTRFWIFLLLFPSLLKFTQPTEQFVWATFHFQKVALTAKSYSATSNVDRMQIKSSLLLFASAPSPHLPLYLECAKSE